MPAHAKGARLYLRRRRGRDPVYVIRDTTGPERSTGTGDRREAEKSLAAYIAEREARRGPHSAEAMTVAAALDLYASDHAASTADPARIGYALQALLPFWGARHVSDTSGAVCRAYAAGRPVSPSTVRRELGVLQAALNHCAREGYLMNAPMIWKPPPGAPRDRWLTRDEAARLLHAARSLRVDGRHLARFILAGLYTGSRKATILSLRIDQPSTEGGWIDTAHGVLYRRAEGKRETRKRQTPARLPRRFLARVRRWKAAGARYVVEDHRGNRVADIRKGWARAAELADLDGITPHVLRHTCATWMMQRGAEPWDAAGYLGMSLETLMKTYGHHHPDHQRSATDALDSGGKLGRNWGRAE